MALLMHHNFNMSEGAVSMGYAGRPRERLDKHLAKPYQGDIYERYGDNVEMRELELCRQAEATVRDSGNIPFEFLFTVPVSGYRLADWLRLAIERARPHLQPEQVQPEGRGYIVPYMSREGYFGRIAMNYVHIDEQDFPPEVSMGVAGASESGLGWLHVYESHPASTHDYLETFGVSLQTRLQHDPVIGLSIYVTTIGLFHGEIDAKTVDEPLSLNYDEAMLTVKPHSPQGERLRVILRHLDDALEFIAND